VTDNRVKDRGVLLNGTSADSVTSEHAVVAPAGVLPNQALHVLTLAQRTAEEHVAGAHHQADKIRTDALAKAEEIARDAQMHAHNVRREADKVLYDARALAEKSVREAQARTDAARRDADKIIAEAQARAESFTADARAGADQLRQQAQQRYDDVVGSLGLRREALQEQIEALERFDREYRAKLTGFMQNQLRALWVDRPQVGELEGAETAEDEPETPAQDPAPEPGTGAARIPAQRQDGDAGTDADADAESEPAPGQR
jgi:vacuolar-type H+-ATPase subunit E/Vma4